ncbi:MAG: molybdenum cofactor biosynthesis protein MoaE [Marinilabiliales bacterium]
MEDGNNKSVLINGPISGSFINQCIKDESDRNSGAELIFLGRVRADIIDGKVIKSIEYSAYDQMVEQEAEKIKTIIRDKYNQVNNILIYHGTGEIKAGEVSLLVVVFSEHRKQGFEALTETVELIKKHFPVWKKEIFEDGSYIWTENI